MNNEYSKQNVLSAAERILWRSEDIKAADERLDFSEQRLPGTMSKPVGLETISPAQFLLQCAATMISPYLACWTDSFFYWLRSMRLGGVRAMVTAMAAGLSRAPGLF